MNNNNIKKTSANTYIIRREVPEDYRETENLVREAFLDYSLAIAKAMGAGALCMEGNIAFYGKAGFVVASSLGIHYYAEPRDAVVPYFLCKELQPGYLNGIIGTYHTPQGYFVDAREVEAFDAKFPRKEKLRLPGQLE